MHPPAPPREHGLLPLGGADLMYWEICGNPGGAPALVLHGGPGSGCTPAQRRLFDPRRYRTVLFDQRNCGRSRPHAADAATDLGANTTHRLVADIETLRGHLGIDRWLVYGASWGSTLALAYAQAHPERVRAMVLCGVTTTTRREIDWLFGGVGRFLPEQWQRFRGAVPEAARDWTAWEDAVVSHEAAGNPRAYSDRPERARLAFVRICTRYFANAAWLAEGALLAGAHRLAGIPGVLVHGRLDLGSPLETAWQLHRAWPGSRLEVVDDSGHTGSPDMRARLHTALDGFAPRGEDG